MHLAYHCHPLTKMKIFWKPSAISGLMLWTAGHGPMSPTLLDITMITGLDISSPNPAAHKMAEVTFKLSSKVNCTNWDTYMSQHMKIKGPVTEKEHTAFLNLWLEHFIFCGPSLAPTKNYLPLAYHLAHGNHTGLGKLFLGETYISIWWHLTCSTTRNWELDALGGLFSCGHNCTSSTIFPTSKAWPRTLSLMRVANQSDVQAMAKLYLVSLAAN